jgi:cation transport ATPase
MLCGIVVRCCVALHWQSARRAHLDAEERARLEAEDKKREQVERERREKEEHERKERQEREDKERKERQEREDKERKEQEMSMPPVAFCVAKLMNLFSEFLYVHMTYWHFRVLVTTFIVHLSSSLQDRSMTECLHLLMTRWWLLHTFENKVWSLVVGRWSLVVGRWLLVVGCWSLSTKRTTCRM